MSSRSIESLTRLLASLGLATAACSSDPGGAAETSSDATTTTTSTTAGPTTGTPTSSDATGDVTGTGDHASTTSTTTATSTTGETIGADTTTGGATATDGTTTTTSTTSTGGTTTTGDTSSSGTSSSDTSSETSETGDSGCVPTEDNEVTCDNLDNDCDDLVDNVDVGNDGICDCLNIGILGNSGYSPNANFEAWLESHGSSVTRTLLQNNPGAVTPALLANYDLVLLDRIERAFSPAEAAALAEFVKQGGNGLITLIGYNFDNDNPVPERDRANTALTPFGLAYQGDYFAFSATPLFDQAHPISMGIADVHFAGGIEPADTGNQGTSTIFATIGAQSAGLAHQSVGGRIVVWGDEWLTFDSDWMDFADVEQFWVQMVDWARPQDICALPQ
jgi:hypothetical protein